MDSEPFRSGYNPRPPLVTDWRAGLETGIAETRDVERWFQFLPAGEPQYLPGGTFKVFDSLSCVSFSVAHSVEAQCNYLLPSLTESQRRTLSDAGFIAGGRVDLSARWLASVSGTTERGNSFGVVLDVARKVGMVPKADWDMQSTLRSFADWISTPPDLSAKAAVFLSIFKIQYQWLFWEGDHLGAAEKLARVGAALPVSPVLVGRPWCPSCNPSRIRAGTIIEDCGVQSAGHATVIHRLHIDGDQDVRDTYEPFDRVFDAGYWIQHAVQAVVTINVPPAPIPKPPAPASQCRLGDRTPAVAALQAALVYLGYLRAPSPNGLPYFGTNTQEALGKFQSASGIYPTAPESFGQRSLVAMRRALA